MRQYEMMELAFEGQAPVGSQSVVDVTATFTIEGKGKTVKGFYDGNNTYKVRFLPEEAGEYTYKVTGLVSGEGSFIAEPADDKHHGVVRADGTHLRHEDGTYIFTAGTTVYALAHQDEETTEQTFAEFEKGYFNKVRMSLFPKHYEYNKNEPEHLAFFRDETAEDIEFTDNLQMPRKVKPFDANRPDFAFWADFEKKLERLFAMDIQVDLILFLPYDRWGHSYMTQENNLIYLDYAIRRLAAYPNIWWSMANEYDLFFNWTMDQWHEVDEFIAANDPYRHMLSNHNCFPIYDFTRPAITHCSLQNRYMGRVAELQKKTGKPVLYDECAYEGNLKENWGNISAKEMVNRFWCAASTGGYCTHGEVILDDDIVTQEQQDNAVLWWAKGGRLKGQSPERIKFLREFMATLPGPIDPSDGGLAGLLTRSQEEIQAMLPMIPEGMRGFIAAIAGMDQQEKLIHTIPETSYAGHIGEDVYIYYLNIECAARFRPTVAEGKTYKVEAIDAWNMTRETVATGFKNGGEVRLPGHEYIAVLCTAE